VTGAAIYCGASEPSDRSLRQTFSLTPEDRAWHSRDYPKAFLDPSDHGGPDRFRRRAGTGAPARPRYFGVKILPAGAESDYATQAGAFANGIGDRLGCAVRT